MIKLEFNASAVFDRLARARAELEDLTPIHKQIAEHMVTATRKRFLSSTAPDGTKWRKKAPSTLAAYLARGDGNKPKPLIGTTGRLGKEIVKLVTRDSAEIGSAEIYSGVMQNGAKKGAFGKTSTNRPIPWGDIPARVWLGISTDDEKTIIQLVDNSIATALGD